MRALNERCELTGWDSPSEDTDRRETPGLLARPRLDLLWGRGAPAAAAGQLAYPRDVLTRLPAMTNHDDIDALTPAYWKRPA